MDKKVDLRKKYIESYLKEATPAEKDEISFYISLGQTKLVVLKAIEHHERIKEEQAKKVIKKTLKKSKRLRK